ncbi:MAG: hypothetical protein Kow0031_37140 [Anaerolineae bacterium]
MLKLFPKSLLIALALLLMVAVTPAVLAAPPVQEEQTIVDIAVADGRFTTLVAALQASGLDRTLSGPGPFTVFAPTDDAFAALPEGTVDALLADIPALSDVLLYHVVSGQVMAADVVMLEEANTLLGEAVTITVGDDGSVMVNDATVVITDIEASNGVIHVIDAVLLPPSMAASAEAEPVDEPEADTEEVMDEEAAQAEGDEPAAATTAESEPVEAEAAPAEAEAAADDTMDGGDEPAEGGQDGGFYYPRNPYYGYYYGYPRYNRCYYGCYQPYYPPGYYHNFYYRHYYRPW